MEAAAQLPRHGALFELLRRQNMAEQVGQSMTDQERARLEESDRQDFLARALKSWSRPREFDLGEEPAPRRASAPEPLSDHEFFRAVGA